MHAVSTNQIADILHFNDNAKYVFHTGVDKKSLNQTFRKLLGDGN